MTEQEPEVDLDAAMEKNFEYLLSEMAKRLPEQAAYHFAEFSHSVIAEARVGRAAAKRVAELEENLRRTEAWRREIAQKLGEQAYELSKAWDERDALRARLEQVKAVWESSCVYHHESCPRGAACDCGLGEWTLAMNAALAQEPEGGKP